MPSKKKAPKHDDAFVDYPVEEPEDLFLAPLVEPTMPGLRWFAYLAIAIFCAGLAVNVCQMALDYAVTTYESNKFMQWQEDQLKGAEPGTQSKDYHVDKHGNVVPNDPNI